MIYFSWSIFTDVPEAIGGAVQSALRSLFYPICSLLYQIVVWLYNTFYILCTSRLLSIDVVNTLSKRIGLILGLVMLFMVIISFIKNLIEPDTLTDKVKGPMNIIKRVLVVIVLFGVSSFAFNGLYYVQNLVLESNIFNKLLIPAQVSNKNFGAQIATKLFMSFYTIDEDVAEAYPSGADSTVTACELKLDILEERIYFVQRFDVGNECLTKTIGGIKVEGSDEEEERFIIDFSWLLCAATAVFLIWFLFSYCISVGVRMFQLAFLEIISPIAFVGYLQPKDDNMFTKWLKIYVSTYIDVFLRIAIISFVVFLIGIILGNGSDGYSNFWNSIGNPDDWKTRRFIEIVMIFALLTFAKKAPDLLKEIFPTGAAKLGLGPVTPKKMFDNMLGGDLIKRGYGAVRVGAATSFANVRRSIGQLIKNGPKQRFDPTRLNNLRAVREKYKKAGNDVAVSKLDAEIASERAKRAQIAKHNAEVSKWRRRLITGGVGGLFTGAYVGLGTTDKSGRKRAIATSVDDSKTNWKLQDAGYGYDDRAMDALRRTVFMDTENEQRAEAMDAYIESLQIQLNEHNKQYPDIRPVKQSKFDSSRYVVYENGQEIDVTDSLEKGEKDYADLNAKIGKAKSASSALHQRENKKKNDK